MAIHPTAIVLSKNIPSSVDIGPFTIISENVIIGENVTIESHVFIDAGVRIFEDAKVHTGARLRKGCTIESIVTVGENSVIKEGIFLHIGSLIHAGANVGMDVPPYAIISATEGTITGYVDAGPDIKNTDSGLMAKEQVISRVRGVKLFELPNHLDLRGNLTVGEFNNDLPFLPKRYFLVYGVASERIRGEHAHYNCHQFLICIHGTCSVIADDGYERQEFRLDRPNQGLHLPPMTWGVQYKFLRDAVLLVFASENYDPEDYIRDYSKFQALQQNQWGPPGGSGRAPNV